MYIEFFLFAAFLSGTMNAFMDKTRDGKDDKIWLWDQQWFIDWSKHYTLRDKKRTRLLWGLINIPNDAWHHVKFAKILLDALAYGMAGIIGLMTQSWWLILALPLGWYALRVAAFSMWYECFFWKDPLEGIENYFKKHDQE